MGGGSETGGGVKLGWAFLFGTSHLQRRSFLSGDDEDDNSWRMEENRLNFDCFANFVCELHNFVWNLFVSDTRWNPDQELEVSNFEEAPHLDESVDAVSCL